MAWVKFKTDFEYRQPSHSIDYKAGWAGSVREQCALAAVAAGAADRIKTPNKGEVVAADETLT